MEYEVKLKSADIRSPLDGEMSLGLEVGRVECASIDYSWSPEHFTARFNGLAQAMPHPAHPAAFISRPIEAINALKKESHTLPSDVFKHNLVTFSVE